MVITKGKGKVFIFENGGQFMEPEKCFGTSNRKLGLWCIWWRSSTKNHNSVACCFTGGFKTTNFILHLVMRHLKIFLRTSEERETEIPEERLRWSKFQWHLVRAMKNGPTTFAFVMFWHEKEAKVAISKGDNRMLEGVRLSVSKAKSSSSAMRFLKNEVRGNDQERVHVGRVANVDGRIYKEVVAQHSKGVQSEVPNVSGEIRLIENGNKERNVPKKSASQKSNEKVIISEESSSSSSSEAVSVSRKSAGMMEMDVDIPLHDMEWLHRSVVTKIRDDASLEVVRETVKALNLDVIITPLSSFTALSLNSWEETRDDRLFRVWIKLEEVLGRVANSPSVCPLMSCVQKDCRSSENFSVEVGDDASVSDDFNVGVESTLGIQGNLLDVSVEVVADSTGRVVDSYCSVERAVLVSEEDMIGGGGFIVEDKLENNRVNIQREVGGISNDEDRSGIEISRPSTGPVNMGSEGINSRHEMDLSLLDSTQERALVCIDNNRPIESKGLNKSKEKKMLMEILREQGKIRSTLSGTSLSDNDINNRNRVILKEAEAIWEVSSALGAVFEDHKESVIKVIAAQEDGDGRV
ncbi:Nucleotide-binding, alpha-beta plait [Corchorus olitorius]|uniref:Nucleotide-binding, alpha-beta plait n=1 Tax=Corchorus olitorius TaxID=93759 RepID=A0A1R3HSM7_9ROSI|nr:Nucleotide-binding, alpha-beta plait [Corchorus olitorius]